MKKILASFLAALVLSSTASQIVFAEEIPCDIATKIVVMNDGDKEEDDKKQNNEDNNEELNDDDEFNRPRPTFIDDPEGDIS